MKKQTKKSNKPVIKISKKARKNKEILLREYREAIGLTQDELGQLVGVNCRSVSAYELCTRKPSTKVAVKLTRIFNVKLQDIFPNY